jgi:hypothetical protein
VLYEDIKRGMFVTVYYAVLQLQKAVLTCVSAGHNPMVLWRKASNTCHLVNPNGLALGIDKGPLLEKTLKEQRVQLTDAIGCGVEWSIDKKTVKKKVLLSLGEGFVARRLERTMNARRAGLKTYAESKGNSARSQ